MISEKGDESADWVERKYTLQVEISEDYLRWGGEGG